MIVKSETSPEILMAHIGSYCLISTPYRLLMAHRQFSAHKITRHQDGLTIMGIVLTSVFVLTGVDGEMCRFLG